MLVRPCAALGQTFAVWRSEVALNAAVLERAGLRPLCDLRPNPGVR
ncbi:hypothetical protein [Paenibacillus oralis]|nr:hypothetical protein [Paenibacillus oralis]